MGINNYIQRLVFPQRKALGGSVDQRRFIGGERDLICQFRHGTVLVPIIERPDPKRAIGGNGDLLVLSERARMFCPQQRPTLGERYGLRLIGRGNRGSLFHLELRVCLRRAAHEQVARVIPVRLYPAVERCGGHDRNVDLFGGIIALPGTPMRVLPRIKIPKIQRHGRVIEFDDCTCVFRRALIPSGTDGHDLKIERVVCLHSAADLRPVKGCRRV